MKPIEMNEKELALITCLVKVHLKDLAKQEDLGVITTPEYRREKLVAALLLNTLTRSQSHWTDNYIEASYFDGVVIYKAFNDAGDVLYVSSERDEVVDHLELYDYAAKKEAENCEVPF